MRNKVSGAVGFLMFNVHTPLRKNGDGALTITRSRLRLIAVEYRLVAYNRFRFLDLE
jgi:hypothetical protein